MEEDEIKERIKAIEDVLVRYFSNNYHNIVGGSQEAFLEIQRLTRYWPLNTQEEGSD